MAGPDGAIYAADAGLGKVWRIADNGRVRSFEIDGGATGIASAHGALWVSKRDGSRIVKLGLDGTKIAYPVTAGAFPADIVLGSDGALWFTESRGNAIGRARPWTARSPSTRCPRRTRSSPTSRAGPDGALWFTESSGNKIGRIRTGGDDHGVRAPDRREHARPDRRRLRRRALVRRAQRQPDRPHDHRRRDHERVSRSRRERAPLALVAGPDGDLYYTQHCDGSSRG